VPFVTSGVEVGSTQVCGQGRPNLPDGCIELVSKDGEVLGTSGTDANGKFCIDVDPPLKAGDVFFPQDVCSPNSSQNPLIGPPVMVIGPMPAPVISNWGWMASAVLLSVVALLALSRRRGRQSDHA